MSGQFEGRRVLVTTADLYVGPAIVEVFRRGGADVIADTTDCTERERSSRRRRRGLDVLVANFAGPRRLLPITKGTTPVTEFADEDFQAYLDVLGGDLGAHRRSIIAGSTARTKRATTSRSTLSDRPSSTTTPTCPRRCWPTTSFAWRWTR